MPNTDYLHKTTGKRLLHVLLGSLVLQLFLICFFLFTTNQTAHKLRDNARFKAVVLVTANRDGCERFKKASKDAAAFRNAELTYIKAVINEPSVGKDVKEASKKAEKIFYQTAQASEKRSRINCNVAFPYPKENK